MNAPEGREHRDLDVDVLHLLLLHRVKTMIPEGSRYRHVLNYMSKLGIYSGTKLFISSLKQYYKHEDVLQKHAYDLSCPVGLLDWAIWIVMRVANQRNMEPVLT